MIEMTMRSYGSFNQAEAVSLAAVFRNVVATLSEARPCPAVSEQRVAEIICRLAADGFRFARRTVASIVAP